MRMKIYLSGPVHNSEDPNSWRLELQDEFGHYNFYNPYEEQKELFEEGYIYKGIMKQLRVIQLCDAILINYIEGKETWGTPVEMFWAYLNGVPVVTWSITDPDNLPPYLLVFSDYICEDIEEGLRRLDRYVVV